MFDASLTGRSQNLHSPSEVENMNMWGFVSFIGIKMKTK